MDFLLLKNVKNSSYYVHGKMLGQPGLKLDIVFIICFFSEIFSYILESREALVSIC